MSIRLGPVLGLAAAADASWSVTALVVWHGKAAPPPARLDPGGNGDAAETVEGTVLETRGADRVVRYRFDLERTAADRSVSYEIAEARHSFVVPTQGKAPRMAYGSCNGFADPAAMKDVQAKQALWRSPSEGAHRGVLDRHAEQPMHVLLLGGDQVYADPIWTRIDGLDDFMTRDRAEQCAREPDAAERDEIAAFYFELYCRRWRQDHLREALASIPGVMMWDDHDIFDGWGSYPEAVLDSPTCQTIFDAAAKHFDLFQRHLAPGESMATEIHPEGENRSSLFELGGGLAVLALDLRTERRRNRVMSDATWRELADRLSRIAEQPAANRPNHLLVMSSIPVVHPDLSWLEGPASAFGSGLEDDLRDHWNSPAHKGERLRLVHRLFALSRLGTRITFLSGDVHVGATGHVTWSRLRDEDPYSDRIEQLTSSGIVHKAPNAIVCFMLEQLARATQDFDADTEARLVKLPGADNRFVTERNWIELTPDVQDGQHRVWADFHIEDADQPLTKVVHPVGGDRGEARDDREKGHRGAIEARRQLSTPSAERV